MRKFLFLLLVLFTFINGKAQTPFNRAYHDYSNAPLRYLLEIQSDYYFISVDQVPNLEGCYLYRYGTNGDLNLQRKLQLPFPEVIKPCIIFRTLDNKVLMIGNHTECDFGGEGVDQAFITKIDTNGNILFNTYITLYPGFKTGLQYPDSSYYVFSDTKMYHFKKSGQLEYQTSLNVEQVSASILMPDGNILLSAKQNSICSIVKVYTNGYIVASYPTGLLFNKLQFYGNQKLIGMTTNLYKMSSNYSVTGMSTFGFDVSDFLVQNDTIYCIGPQYYACTDTSFSSIFQSSTITSEVSQLALCKKRNLIGVLSNCRSDLSFQANNPFASISLFDKYGSNNFTEDAQISSVVADTAYLSPYGQACLKAKIRMKNNGINVLNTVKVNCFKYYSVICGEYYFQQSFSGLNVNPGGSIELEAGFACKSNFGGPTNSITTNFCFYTTVPNGMNDKDISNDGKCISITVSNISVKENALDSFRFVAYPNPAMDQMEVECELPVKKAVIVNCLGMPVKSNLPESKKFTLNCSELSSGIYFLKVETDKGSRIEKIIKE